MADRLRGFVTEVLQNLDHAVTAGSVENARDAVTTTDRKQAASEALADALETPPTNRSA